MLKSLKELSKDELSGKKVFLRVDFNVPVEDGKIKEKYRLLAHKETIDFLLSAGARVALASHILGSFRIIAGDIGRILNHEIVFEEDILNPELNSPLTLFENIRRYEGEEENNKRFAGDLAGSFDIYVNDAFSASHRNHASISIVAELVPSYAGFLLTKEVENLGKILKEPAEGKTVILGGAKVSTKLPVIKNLLAKADNILIGGALANTIFKFKGLNIGLSFAENSKVGLALKEIDFNNSKILLPKDVVASGDKSGNSDYRSMPVGDLSDNQYILDIGPEAAGQFSEIINNSRMIIFNGPLGLAEVEAFSAGTKTVLDSIISSGAFSVIGGGDTLALIEKLGLFGKFGYVSTGGGAMLEFLAGNKLPGLEALGYYEK